MTPADLLQTGAHHPKRANIVAAGAFPDGHREHRLRNAAVSGSTGWSCCSTRPRVAPVQANEMPRPPARGGRPRIGVGPHPPDEQGSSGMVHDTTVLTRCRAVVISPVRRPGEYLKTPRCG